jgi:uncharacterized protein YdeI (YjbR/CyaY-like superfamily)
LKNQPIFIGIFSPETMSKYDKKVDAYISKSAAFAQPILEHIRQLVHEACPDVEETIKWSFPHFNYNGILGSMAAFKNHCSFGFWKGAIMKDPHQVMSVVGKTSMGSFDKITSLKDLPPDRILKQYIKEAAQLNEDDIKVPRAKPKQAKPVEAPPDFLKALKKDKRAFEIFQGFSNSNKKDYVQWITEAKTDATRQTRLATALEWIAAGKVRNWKYLKK